MSMGLEGSSVVRTCRICGTDRFEGVVSLGLMPLANRFIRPEQAAEAEPRYPLEVIRCQECELVQLSVVVDPEILFRDYAYASSASAPVIEHFAALATDLAARFKLRDRLVVEIGSNDGVLLDPLARRGARVLGIEPARGQSTAANARGLETWNEFFDEGVARRVRAERGRAALVIGNNVLAHMSDLSGVARAVGSLLDDDGVFVFEVPYLLDLLDRVEYDTIYHEHLSYFHLAPLKRLFSDAGMAVFHVERLSVHGGSIRVYVGHAGRRSASPQLAAMSATEGHRLLADQRIYRSFAESVVASRVALNDLLADRIAAGWRIAGYGASAKGNTLLNYCAIGPDVLEYVADTTPYKQGLLTPGTRIPVVPERRSVEDPPDALLLLAWNYADSIVERKRDYIARGGRFIHPIPLARLIP